MGSPNLGTCVAFWKHRASRDRISSLTFLPDGMIIGAANNMVIAVGTAKEIKGFSFINLFFNKKKEEI